MKAMDFVNPHHIGKRIKTFDITQGMIIVDYGCGLARYTLKYAKLVGNKGKVYAVDIQELAIKAVQKKIEKNHLSNNFSSVALHFVSKNNGVTIDLFYGNKRSCSTSS